MRPDAMSRVVNASLLGITAVLFTVAGCGAKEMHTPSASPATSDATLSNARQMIDEGRRTFRFDTFGSEAFWGQTLQLHQALAGDKLGGIGNGVSPKTALAVGLKVDSEALPASLVHQMKKGMVDLEWSD